MAIVLTGGSHKTAPVEIREQLAFAKESLAESLRALVDGRLVREGMILSTCNRVEVLADVDPARVEEGRARVVRFLTSRDAEREEVIAAHTYMYTEEAAVRHLFGVAASLDS